MFSWNLFQSGNSYFALRLRRFKLSGQFHILLNYCERYVYIIHVLIWLFHKSVASKAVNKNLTMLRINWKKKWKQNMHIDRQICLKSYEVFRHGYQSAYFIVIILSINYLSCLLLKGDSCSRYFWRIPPCSPEQAWSPVSNCSLYKKWRTDWWCWFDEVTELIVQCN